ncbi:hypothetical protein K0T92_17045 [Paenibacillus oenotherae]|uniref:CGNR zinc finger domain-containing protein n=1 Tax=Paenibacillus oenotherae TaxID=1435645 RepID=A0ABS7DAB8_9BACL|nr:hypothetical protein [Paenibacillus oenotherae]MBW7476442.1 hypothetical protein [Paenibacillus oenotherae]
MSPILARPQYFLHVLNRSHGQPPYPQGSLEHELHDLLFRLAESVRVKQQIDESTVERINAAFEQYQALRLKLTLRNPSDSLFKQGNGGRQYDGQQLLLHTEFVDGQDNVRRMYMEAMLSLLEAMEQGGIELQNCVHCRDWFIPYQRAQVAKFCSAKCRNRANYLQKQQKESISV